MDISTRFKVFFRCFTGNFLQKNFLVETADKGFYDASFGTTIQKFIVMVLEKSNHKNCVYCTQSLKFNKFPISNLWVDELKSQCFLHIKICLNFLLFGQFTEKHLYWILLLNKVVGSLKLYYKIDSGKTAFLLILQNFEKHFFYRIPAHSTVSEMYTLGKRRENIMFSFTLQKNFLWMEWRCRVLE